MKLNFQNVIWFNFILWEELVLLQKQQVGRCFPSGFCRTAVLEGLNFEGVSQTTMFGHMEHHSHLPGESEFIFV